MGDRVTKLLLAAIALGLWANLLPSILTPARARADGQLDFYVAAIYNGTCVNHKIC